MIDYENCALLPRDSSRRMIIEMHQIENGFVFLWDVTGDRGAVFASEPLAAFEELFAELTKLNEEREARFAAERPMKPP